MYRLGERKKSRRGFYVWLVIVVLVILGGGLGSLFFLKPSTHISKPPAPTVRKITYDEPKVKTFNEKYFSITLPDDFKATTISGLTAQSTYTWQGTSGEDVARWVSLYFDQVPAQLPVNRVIHVQANGAAISVISAVSDNCTSFGATANPTTGMSQAKWEGLSFLCDTGNYSRDVVGTVAPDGINEMAMTGSSGQHKLFFTYTDNSHSADYTIFTKALKSFVLK